MKRLCLLLLVLLVAAGCSDRPDTPEGLKKAGMKAYLNGEYAEARSLLLDALKDLTSDKEVLYFTGLAYKRDYILDSALFYIKRADLLYPEDRELNQELYELSINLGDWKYAQQAIMVLVKTGDPIENYYFNLVDVWSNMGSIINTFYYLKKIYTEIGFEEQSQFTRMAGLAAQMDSLEIANSLLDSAVTRFGRNDDLLFTEAKIRFHERNLEEAERLLRDLLSRTGSVPEYKINLANVLANHESDDKKREALSIYREMRSEAADPAMVDTLIVKLEKAIEK